MRRALLAVCRTRVVARGDRGSAVVEVAILAPVFLLLLGFVVFVGRLSSLEQSVHSAARDAARAASLAADPVTAADEVTRGSLEGQAVSCQDPRVEVDTTNAEPGGSVAVTVTCGVSLAGLSGFPLPGNRSVSARSVATIDRFAVGAS